MALSPKMRAFTISYFRQGEGVRRAAISKQIFAEKRLELLKVPAREGAPATLRNFKDADE
jgi:hypothetical protein